MRQLLLSQPRDDYRELLELTVIFLGGIPARGVKFMAPGAIHHARWMAKALYSLKIWLFRGQFKLTAREEKGLHDVCMFVVLLYVSAWFTAPYAASSPRNDLRFLKQLCTYNNQAIAKVASHKFAGHLWYLSEELVGLAFFDTDISVEIKRAMVRAMNDRDGLNDPPKRVQVNTTTCSAMSIEDFVTKNTRLFFERLGLSQEFLSCDPDVWMLREDYQEGLNTVKHLRVVNDNAERGVALIEEYNSIITKKENQKQYLLQVVKDHRTQFPDCLKRTIMAHD
jgi:hypothetical protein